MSESKLRSLAAIRFGLIVTGGGLLLWVYFVFRHHTGIAVPLEWMIGGAIFLLE